MTPFWTPKSGFLTPKTPLFGPLFGPKWAHFLLFTLGDLSWSGPPKGSILTLFGPQIDPFWTDPAQIL